MFKRFFLPHPDTHQKAHLISWQAFLIYILFFLILRAGAGYYNELHPGILGISANVSQPELIALTNKQRATQGLNPLKENSSLNAAAAAKAQNMFAEDYWAHYAPSGKTPWDFIKAAGYTFTYAGENLARNFYTSSEVVDAWMNSPTHRENILNNRYEEIGIAVAEGTLKGQKTILVVQEFGKPPLLASQPTPIQSGPTQPEVVTTPAPLPTIEPTSLPAPVVTIPQPVQGVEGQKLQSISISTLNRLASRIDPFQAWKTVGLIMLGFLMGLIALDLYIMRKRLIWRVSSRHLPHLVLLGIAASALVQGSPGSIL